MVSWVTLSARTTARKSDASVKPRNNNAQMSVGTVRRAFGATAAMQFKTTAGIASTSAVIHRARRSLTAYTPARKALAEQTRNRANVQPGTVKYGYRISIATCATNRYTSLPRALFLIFKTFLN